MALVKTGKEIEVLREGGRILWNILRKVGQAVRPGVSTFDLDLIARQEIKKAGVEAAFPGYRIGPKYPPFPAALCASINSEIVHGIPKKDRVLKEGDIVGLDLGIKFRGLYTDAAITVPVGKIDEKSQKLISATAAALEAGIEAAAPGNTIGDIGHAIESAAKAAGLGVVRDLVGHGVGHAIHEPPNIPNYGRPGTLEELKKGMVIAIEPMFTLGARQIVLLDDGWTMVTEDGSRAAHFEKTVAVTEKGHLVLTE